MSPVDPSMRHDDGAPHDVLVPPQTGRAPTLTRQHFPWMAVALLLLGAGMLAVVFLGYELAPVPTGPQMLP